jgi:hypothetical protein
VALEVCGLIPYLGAGLRRFIESGQLGCFHVPKDVLRGINEDFRTHCEKLDVIELCRQLSLSPKAYEDVWREWFLPTSLGELTSAP